MRKKYPKTVVIDNLTYPTRIGQNFSRKLQAEHSKNFAKTNPNLSYHVQKPKGMTGLDWTMEQKEISLIKF